MRYPDIADEQVNYRLSLNDIDGVPVPVRSAEGAVRAKVTDLIVRGALLDARCVTMRGPGRE